MLAAGQLPWSPLFDASARQKLIYAFRDAAPDSTQWGSPREEVADLARTAVLREEGLPSLAGIGYPVPDLERGFEDLPDDLVPTLIEATGLALKGFGRQFGEDWHSRYVTTVGEILYEHAISYDYVFPQMVERDSQELHAEIVAPVIRLLAGRAEFNQVEAAYQKALREIGQDPADAITDAATALQEMLNVMGANGGTLGAKLKAARNTGLLAPYDEKLVAGVVEWTEAARSSEGDAHNARPAKREDAWLAVHVVGALIRRLAEGSRA